MIARKLTMWISLGLVLGSLAGVVRAQEPTGASGLTENDVQKIVGDYLKTLEPSNPADVGATAPQPQSAEHSAVGPDLQNKGKGDYDQWFVIPNKNLFFQFGGWVQFDGGWWGIRR